METVEIAAYIAVSTFNEDNNTLLQMLKKLGIGIGIRVHEYCGE
jgi:hypothetical protein